MTVMKKAADIEQEALDFGFEWPNPELILEQIISECHEVAEVITEHQGHERLQEEIGDLMLATIELCQFFQLDPEEILDKAAIKFQKRFEEMKKQVNAKGYVSLKGQPCETRLEFWKASKKVVG